MNNDIDITVHSDSNEVKEEVVLVEDCADHRYTDSGITDQIGDAIKNGNHNLDGSLRYDFSKNPVFSKVQGQGQKINSFVERHKGQTVIFLTNVASDPQENIKAIEYFDSKYRISVLEIGHHDCGGLGMRCACDQGTTYQDTGPQVSKQINTLMGHLEPLSKGSGGDRTLMEAQNASFQISELQKKFPNTTRTDMLPVTANFEGMHKVEDAHDKVLLIANSDDVSRIELSTLADVDAKTKGVYVLRTRLTENMQCLDGIASSLACSVVGLHITDIRLVPNTAASKSSMELLAIGIKEMEVVKTFGAKVTVADFYRNPSNLPLRKAGADTPKKVTA